MLDWDVDIYVRLGVGNFINEVVMNRQWWYTIGGGRDAAGAVDVLAGLLHMSFGRGQTRIEIFYDSMHGKIWAPFEVPTIYCFY